MLESTSDGRRGVQRRMHPGLTGTAKAFSALGALAVTLAACGSAGSASSPTASASSGGAPASSNVSALSGGFNISGKKILLEVDSVPSNTFFVPAVTGAKAAAAIAGLNLQVEYASNSDTTESSQIATAIASGVSGIAAVVPDIGVAPALCKAAKAHIPVTAFNIDALTGTSSANCAQSFVGQSFVQAGELIASYMVSQGLIKAGDQVFCPVESPEQVYAIQRRQGVENVLKPLGITCNEIGTGDNLAPAKADMVNYLLGHPNTSAIIALGGTPLAEAEAAIKQVGKKIPIGGFDLSFPEIVSGIKDGAIAASVNQEPYAQGYYAVMELALELKYGIPPSTMNTSDNALITKSNVQQFSQLVPNYQ